MGGVQVYRGVLGVMGGGRGVGGVWLGFGGWDYDVWGLLLGSGGSWDLW